MKLIWIQKWEDVNRIKNEDEENKKYMRKKQKTEKR